MGSLLRLSLHFISKQSFEMGSPNIKDPLLCIPVKFLVFGFRICGIHLRISSVSFAMVRHWFRFIKNWSGSLPFSGFFYGCSRDTGSCWYLCEAFLDDSFCICVPVDRDGSSTCSEAPSSNRPASTAPPSYSRHQQVCSFPRVPKNP